LSFEISVNSTSTLEHDNRKSYVRDAPFLARFTEMNSDPLSDVLQMIEAKGVMSTGLKATGDWAVAVDRHDGLKFNAVIDGSCVVSVENSETFVLEAGDCFLLTQGLPFIIASESGIAPQPARDVFAGAADHLAVIDGGEEKPFLCIGGRMEVASDIDFVMGSLPPVVVVKASDEASGRIRWLLDRIIAELRDERPGAALMCGQLMHLIFVEMIRQCPQANGHSGWLEAVSDPRVGRAISAIHSNPGKSWRLDELAAAASLSRSQFSSRFVALLGMAPIEYLLRWRMEIARRALRKPGIKVAALATELGYRSEAAFGAAFKRVHGCSPRRLSIVDR
jgi:AraC-like DNA-binding protein/uncharacterized cupin superfamily protein